MGLRETAQLNFFGTYSWLLLLLHLKKLFTLIYFEDKSTRKFILIGNQFKADWLHNILLSISLNTQLLRREGSVYKIHPIYTIHAIKTTLQ